jgi:GGDEF domain-containing protein
MALHRIVKNDGRSFVDYIMQQKKTHGAGAFMYGFGPKLARYMGLMAGMGNMIVPDRHMMRSLFNLSLAQKPEFDVVQRTLAPMEGEPILRALDRHFLQNNPSVAKAQELYPDHFGTRKEQAVGPGFWLHWLAYPQYELLHGRPTENANAGTAHDPFWQAIPQILNEEGIPHDFPQSPEPWLQKSDSGIPGIPERVANATKKVETQFGEAAASMFFHAYGIPALMHNEQMSEIPNQSVHKAEFDAIEEASLIKREYTEIESSRLCKTMDLADNDEIYTVDGDYSHGRFWVKSGQLRILEDHEGILKRYLQNGPVEACRAGIGQLIMAGHQIEPESPVVSGKEIDLGDADEDQVRPGGTPEAIEDPHMDDGPMEIETPAAVNDLKPPPAVFDLMEAGSNTPERIEIKEGVVYQNGFKLKQEDADYLLHLVRTGRATIRYVKNDVDQKLAKMAAHFEDLAKTAPEVRQAMTGLHAAAKAGHIKPEHADAIRRGLFTDRLTGGRIGNQAAHEDFIEGLQGKKDQGVHVHIDANDFGSINKLHGMPVGDQAIKTLAGAMRDTIDKHIGRKNAKLFRVGGDEFKAHFQTPAHAAVFARALRHNLDQAVPVGGTHRLSTSIGMGHTPEHAEQALINAKNEKQKQNYPIGQAEHHAHSLLPGHEGPVPLAASSVPRVRLQPR